MSAENNAKRLYPERLTVAQLCGRALRWSAVVAGIIAGAYVALALVRALIGSRAPDVGGLTLGAAAWLVGSFGVLFLLRLVWQSRELQDRSFTWVGFLATFFGLGMLVIFFVQLGVQAAAWFRVSPRLIDYENYRYHIKVYEAEFALKNKEAKTDAETVEILQGGDPKVLAFYEKHLKGQWEKLLIDAEKAAGAARESAGRSSSTSSGAIGVVTFRKKLNSRKAIHVSIQFRQRERCASAGDLSYQEI